MLARKKLDFTWFTLYAILGDDIVIADNAVAKEYLKIMDELGVGIGIAKSLISSSKVIEFAKKFWTPEDATPIPFKELLVAERNSSVLFEFAKKYNLSLPSIMTMMGFGYKVKGALHSPFIKLGGRVVKTLLALTSPTAQFGRHLKE